MWTQDCGLSKHRINGPHLHPAPLCSLWFQKGLEFLGILLALSSKFWDYKCALPQWPWTSF